MSCGLQHATTPLNHGCERKEQACCLFCLLSGCARQSDANASSASARLSMGEIPQPGKSGREEVWQLEVLQHTALVGSRTSEPALLYNDLLELLAKNGRTGCRGFCEPASMPFNPALWLRAASSRLRTRQHQTEPVCPTLPSVGL